MSRKRSIAAHQGGGLDERTAAGAPFVTVYGTMANASSAKLDEAIVGGNGAPTQAMKNHTQTEGGL